MRPPSPLIRSVGIAALAIAAVAPAVAVAQPGTTWSQGTAAANSQWQSAAYGNGTFVAVAPQVTPRVSTSVDGTTWTGVALSGPLATRLWQSVWFANDRFIVFSNPLDLSDTGFTMSSADGTTWVAGTLPAGSQWTSVAYGNGVYVAVSYSGANEVMTSTDGVNWTVGTAPASALRRVVFGGGQFVAVSIGAAGGKIITSPDGVNWTHQVTAPTSDWTSLTYGDGKFVAVSADAAPTQVATSPDGGTWTLRATPGSVAWDEVAFGDGTFVATGDAGAVMSSSDGIAWTTRSAPVTAPASQNWRALAFGRGRFAALSRNGSSNLGAMYSGDLWTVPGAPTGVRGIARDGAAVVEWVPPASDGGRPITGYRVTASPTGAQCTSSGGSCTVSGLANGGTYTFTVTATNAEGTSAASAASDPVSLAQGPGTAAGASSGGSGTAPSPVPAAPFAREFGPPARISFGRGRPGVAQVVSIDRPGAYTFSYVTSRGRVAPMLPGSSVGSRTMRTSTREVTLPRLRAGATVRLRARLAPRAVSGARLRVSFVPDPESLLLPAG